MVIESVRVHGEATVLENTARTSEEPPRLHKPHRPLNEQRLEVVLQYLEDGTDEIPISFDLD